MSKAIKCYKKCAYTFLKTDSKDYTLLLLRLGLGIFMFFHGAQKMWGWFGGPGYEGAMGFLTGMGIPGLVAFLVIVGEALGGLALIVGFKVRFMAAAAAIILIGAISLVHMPVALNGPGIVNGFPEYEKQLLGLIISLVIMVKGAGALSLDSVMSKIFVPKHK